MDIRELRDAHKGADVWVIGSGGSLNYIDPDFFDGRITVGVNRIAQRWRPVTYSVTKYHQIAIELADNPAAGVVVVPRHQHGNTDHSPWNGPAPCVVFDHGQNAGEHFDADRCWPTDPDHLVVSWSTITSAMHLAAYMGAANVLVVGHDCGELGGEFNLYGYYPTPQSFDESAGYELYDAQSVGVKRRLQELYGVRVYSLNPFLNFRLEGVSFVSGSKRLNA